MNKTRIQYFEQEDVLHLTIAEGPESRSLELSPNITVELNDQNELIGDSQRDHLSAGCGVRVHSGENASSAASRSSVTGHRDRARSEDGD